MMHGKLVHSVGDAMTATNLNQLAQVIHQIAIDHGWWENERNFGESLALVHSEISEVLEDWRHGYEMTEIVYNKGPHSGLDKPGGIPIELADVIIRVLDLVAFYGIDIDTAIAEKVEYNRHRPYRHGNLKA